MRRTPFVACQRAFTLLEVMVALAVIAIALGALLKAVASYGVNVQYLQHKTIAQWVALNQLTQYQLQPDFWPELGIYQRGTAQMAGQNWLWQAEISATFNDYIHRVIVTVRNEHDPAPLVSVAGFIQQPAKSARP